MLGGKKHQRLSDEATVDRSAVELRAHAVVLSDARRAARPVRALVGRSAATDVAGVPSAGASGLPDITVAGVAIAPARAPVAPEPARSSRARLRAPARVCAGRPRSLRPRLPALSAFPPSHPARLSQVFMSIAVGMLGGT